MTDDRKRAEELFQGIGLYPYERDVDALAREFAEVRREAYLDAANVADAYSRRFAILRSMDGTRHAEAGREIATAIRKLADAGDGEEEAMFITAEELENENAELRARVAELEVAAKAMLQLEERRMYERDPDLYARVRPCPCDGCFGLRTALDGKRGG